MGVENGVALGDTVVVLGVERSDEGGGAVVGVPGKELDDAVFLVTAISVSKKQ